MKFSLPLILGLATAAYAQITTFPNIGCTGTAATFPCDGSCHPWTTGGQGAFKTVAGTTHCVTMFLDAACTQVAFPNPGSDGTCLPIESGNPILSFSCSADNTCA
ncbi:hypothetical protein FB45DRAFT_902797 [Roridomyces roridus]|uniref:Uncharacterized protein n=1 Tax=Roridomyces roridus TaxID=1738132 RepID=A0AAD7AX20_9AGAR|nr:hypothetical protein FB45DRAFT_969349 [Roridomyces roridus]KAJ7638423.1 hypothetical protein FB45DRAFT_902797 [Roridomyces roridus]